MVSSTEAAGRGAEAQILVDGSGKTLYVFLAEGIDEMLVLGTDPNATLTKPAQPVPLRDVGTTMATWLDVPAPDPAGRPIETLFG